MHHLGAASSMSAKPSAATTRGMTLAGLLAVLVCTGCATGGVTVPASRPAAAVTPPAASASETERALLAPSGRLRVGVYPGSPTSLVRDASGQARGVSVEVDWCSWNWTGRCNLPLNARG